MTATPTAAVAAPVPQSAVSSDQNVQHISIERLMPSEFNPRKTIDPAFLAQLADSIEQLGVQVPLLVRRMPGSAVNTNPQYEIVAGHRRYFAAKMLKLQMLPCIVREISDDEASEIMLVENLQREDLPPLEEAEAYDRLRATLGTVASVAAKVGKPIEYVTRRLKLLTLISFSRDALAHRLITLDHALLLAKLAPAEQETALRFALKDTANRSEKTADILTGCIKRRDDKQFSRYWEPESVLELKAFIEREIKLELKRAPWDLADEDLLASAGACVGCPKNTAENTALFGDLAVEDARCTDSACFAAKRAAFVQVQLDAVKAAGADARRISWAYTTSKPRALDDEKKYVAQTFKAGQWIEAKKGSCGFVRTGVTVDFDEQKYGTPDAKKKPGMRLLVCVAAGCKAHPKAWEQTERAHPNGADDARAQREKREKQAELNKAENAIRAEAVKAAIGGVSKLGGELLRRVVQQGLPDWHDTDIEAIFPGLEPALEKEKVDSPKFARAAAAVLLCAEDASYFASPHGYRDAEDGRDELIKLLAVMGYDARKHWPKKSPAAPAKVSAKASPARKSSKATAKKAAGKSSAKASKRAAKKGGRA